MKTTPLVIRPVLASAVLGLMALSVHAQTPAPAAKPTAAPAPAAKPEPAPAPSPAPAAPAADAATTTSKPQVITTTANGVTTTITITISTAPAGPPPLDFGDAKSSTLVGKAWDAFNDKNYKDAAAFAQKCIDLYEAQAIQMQAGLKEKPDKEAAAGLWALNDVGTCYYIIGKSAEKQHDKKTAIAAYTVLTEKLGFAQSWDPSGWYWTPADAATKSLADLSK